MHQFAAVSTHDKWADPPPPHPTPPHPPSVAGGALGFGALGLGIKVLGPGFEVPVPGFSVLGLGFKVWGHPEVNKIPLCWASVFQCWASGFRCIFAEAQQHPNSQMGHGWAPGETLLGYEVFSGLGRKGGWASNF